MAESSVKMKSSESDEYVPPIKKYNMQHPHENEGTEPFAMLKHARLDAYLKSHSEGE